MKILIKIIKKSITTFLVHKQQQIHWHLLMKSFTSRMLVDYPNLRNHSLIFCQGKLINNLCITAIQKILITI